MNNEPVVRSEVTGWCGASCGGDLRAIVADGAWSAEKCSKCNGTWWFQVPRPLDDIALAEAAEKKRRGPDLAGQIASLKDHLRIADERADKARDILRRIVDACDEEDGEIDSALIDEARECLDGAAIQSPITDAAIDAAVTKSGQDMPLACEKCDGVVRQMPREADPRHFEASKVPHSAPSSEGR